MPIYVHGKGSTNLSKIEQILTMDSTSPYVLVNGESSKVLLANYAALGSSENSEIIYVYATDENAVPTLVYEKPQKK